MNNQPYYPPPQPPQQKPGQGLAIAGMVCGIVSLVLFWIPFFGVVPPIVGLVLSVLGMKKLKEAGVPTGMAVAGMVCSIIALPLSVFICAFCFGGGAVGCCVTAAGIPRFPY